MGLNVKKKETAPSMELGRKTSRMQLLTCPLFYFFMERKFDDDLTKEYIEKLFPAPREPASAETNNTVIKSSYI